MEERKHEPMRITRREIAAALRTSSPIMVTFLVLGTGYGILMQKHGFGPVWSLLSGIVIFSGTVQFVSVSMLSAGSPVMAGMLVILVMGLATLTTRVLPVLIFGRGEKVPETILYLGKVVPYTAMGLLIVYCLKDVSLVDGAHGLPEAIALAVVTASYLWKRNTILSVVVGTAVYMLLVQQVF